MDTEQAKFYQKVQLLKLITSYAISPQAFFTCPPCSIRFRRLRNEPARRYTYCSVTSSKPQIVCFSEQSNAQITTTSITLDKKAAPVSHLDTFETGSGISLIALHEDGQVTGYSDDLKSKEWHSSINADDSTLASAPAALAAATMSVHQARQTVLRSRADILATLGPDDDAINGSLFLVMTRPPMKDANRSAGALELRIFHTRSPRSYKSGFALETGQKLKLLTTVTMPEPSDFVSKKVRITMHTASGTVYQDTGGMLAVYDLTGSVPRLAHTVVRKDMFSYLRVSPELVASIKGTSLSVIDLTYGSLQDEGILTLDHEAKVGQEFETLKDKPNTTHTFQLLSYFAPLGVVVALDGRRLSAVQLLTTQEVGGSRKRKREGLLVNSIGRGSSSMTTTSSASGASARGINSLGTYLPFLDRNNWTAQKTALDRCIAQNDEAEFENLMAAALGMNAIGQDKQMSVTEGRNHINRHAVSYAIKAIFFVDQAYPDADPADNLLRSLNIRFFPHRIVKWLVDKGLLSLSHIEISLKQYGAFPVTSKLGKGSLIRALEKFDSSLEILLSLIASPVPLASQELVHILAIVTRAPSPEATEPQRLLTNNDRGDDSGSIDDLQLSNGHPTDSIPSPCSSRPADDITRRLLSFVLKRLYVCSPASVVRALKKELSTPQLRLLVDSLRMEIARSGWLSPYEDHLEPLDLTLPDDSQMCSIAHLLNCVIDSLGTGGWILGTSMSDDLTETADTIAYMKAEISAALEGIEEVTYLKGMLGEMLLCGKDSLNGSVKQSRSNEAQLPVLSTKPETIALDEEGPQLLPLGLKAAPVISTTKVGAGGELIKRSRRDIGRLKSRMVEKYSFDRIMI